MVQPPRSTFPGTPSAGCKPWVWLPCMKLCCPSSTALFIANSGNDTVSDFSAYLNGAVTTIGLLPGSHPVFLTATQTTNMYVLNSGDQFDVSEHRFGQRHPGGSAISYEYSLCGTEPDQHGSGGEWRADLRPESGRQYGPRVGHRFGCGNPDSGDDVDLGERAWGLIPSTRHRVSTVATSSS